MGILPGGTDWQQDATLGCNDSGKFEDRWVYLRAPDPGSRNPASRCIWTQNIEKVIYLPVAHGEGKFITKDQAALQRLYDNGQVVLQYCDKSGHAPQYPDNPNGSAGHIAGICDSTGRVFGLMPHPERYAFRTQHPHWTRETLPLVPAGLGIFRNGIEFLKKS
jgi:phosphoribosylformylglycinamidine synthase